MVRPFTSPSDFLSHVQGQRRSPLPESGPNLKFQKIHQEKLQTFRREVGEVSPAPPGVSPYAAIVESLWNDVEPSLPSGFDQWASEFLAVGFLEHMRVNAVCTRSAEGFYAICLNSGLMALFNKVSKLLIAQSDPTSVVYCNREVKGELTREILFGWYMEVAAHYRDTLTPLGPQMHLRPDAEAHHAAQLIGWEHFILCHEIAHLLAGHLEPQNWHQNREFGMLETYSSNGSHQHEHEADILGFLLMRRVVQLQHKDLGESSNAFSDAALLARIVSLFDLMYLLGGTGSNSHPSSLDRGIQVTETIYGREAAEFLRTSYDDKQAHASLFESLPAPLLDAESCLRQLWSEHPNRRKYALKSGRDNA